MRQISEMRVGSVRNLLHWCH